MSDDIFEKLADALDKLPNGFPRTPSKIEIRILKKIFSVDEASVASHLGGIYEPVETIAKRIKLSPEETENKLKPMAKRGVIWSVRKDDTSQYRLAPFIVGFFEEQLGVMDHEFAHLVEDYMANGGAAGIMKPQPAIHRVAPAQNAVKSEWILPYDDIKAILLNCKTFRLRDCVCREQQDYVGRRCDFPLKTCLSFSKRERPPDPNSISQEEALDFLDKSEEMGLVHTVSNVMEGVGYICNCCGCCCGILRGITDWGIEKSVASANYYVIIDPELCAACGTCIERCQVNAISSGDEVSVVNREICIGCGICVTGCPNDAARLQLKPEEERIDPPADFAAWERERLLNRGLID